MNTSFAIPVHNEHEELNRLIGHILKYKNPEDEIVIQCDQGNTTPEVYKVLSNYEGQVKIIEFPLNLDFASFKNNLKENCTGDWIFQIDADEYPDDYLISLLPSILKQNPTIEVFWVPRINLVDGLTTEHINKWRWNVNEKGWVNFPDYQCRILQNTPKIKWVSKVHEVLIGHSSESKLPCNEEYCLHHPKSIEKQEHQNEFYNTL